MQKVAQYVIDNVKKKKMMSDNITLIIVALNRGITSIEWIYIYYKL